MPIKPRTTIPYTAHSEYEEGDPTVTGRAAALQGLHLDVYRFIADNPDCTRDEVSRATHIKSSTCTARIKELIDEGYLFEPGKRKRNRSGVNAKCLRITSRQEGSKPLDKVRVEVTLAIDCNGDYYAEAEVIGGKPKHLLRNAVTKIKKQRYTMTAPHPDTYASTIDTSEVSKVNRMEIEAHGEDIIDAEYVIVEEGD